MASKKRDELVETALKLFTRNGYRATGIDRILAESGVAKMTLYNHFRSKDELILAALRMGDERWRNWFMKEVEHRADRPGDRLLAVFDVLMEWFGQEDFCGCAFVKVCCEFGECDNLIHAAGVEHYRLLGNYIGGIAREAGAKDPDRLTRQLSLLMTGAIFNAQLTGGPGSAADAREAAELLVRHALS